MQFQKLIDIPAYKPKPNHFVLPHLLFGYTDWYTAKSLSIVLVAGKVSIGFRIYWDIKEAEE